MAVQSHKVWRAISGMSLLCLIGFATWLFLPGLACPVPDNLFTDEQLKLIRLPAELERLTRPNCLEFWLNRYQALLGAILALAAAYVATVPARGQLREMSRQSAASGRQSMLDLAFAFEAELDLIHEIKLMNPRLQALIADYDEHDLHEIYQSWPQNWFKKRIELRDLTAKLRVTHNRYGANQSGSVKRARLLAAMIDVYDRMHVLNTVIRQETNGLDYENGDEDLPFSVVEIASSEAADSLMRMADSANVLIRELTASVRSAWAEVRQLEDRSLGR